MNIFTDAQSLELDRDIEAYRDAVAQLRAGGLTPAEFKPHGAVRGVYEQRTDGAYMLRVRLAGGVLSSIHMRLLSEVARRFGVTRLHMTTRQDIQFHDVRIEDTPDMMSLLKTGGLVCKGGGGNTVRNVMACPYAGMCPAERFDVTPYAQALTEFFLAQPSSYTLPRKFKVAFSGCNADCALARVTDVGFVARVKDGRPGFEVYGDGGMGPNSRKADLLEDWIPASDVIRVAESVRRIFDQMGDRQNRSRARLRYVVEKMGVPAFLEVYRATLHTVISEGVPVCTVPGELVASPPDACGETPDAQVLDGFRVIRQRQAGVSTVVVDLPHGFIAPDRLMALADIADAYSPEHGCRATQNQSLLLRFVRESVVSDLIAALKRGGLEWQEPAALRQIVSCVGATVCRIGLCNSQGAALATARALDAAGVNPEVLAKIRIRFSGCPNSCGQQLLADIGLTGRFQQIDGKRVPSYQVTLGARNDEAGIAFGEVLGVIPEDQVPDRLVVLIKAYQSGRSGDESFRQYVNRDVSGTGQAAGGS